MRNNIVILSQNNIEMSDGFFQVSLLLGTIVRKVPLPTHTIIESHDSDNLIRSADKNFIVVDEMLGFSQLQNIGNHFLQVLFKMKHNGAIDKTRAGFTALCNRLLSSNDQRYVCFHLIPVNGHVDCRIVSEDNI